MCCFLLLVYLVLSVTARDVSAEEVDCQVYNHLYVCLGNSVLHSVAFEDVNAVQTIEDIELHLEGLGIQDIAKDAFLEVTNSSALYIRDNHFQTLLRRLGPTDVSRFEEQQHKGHRGRLVRQLGQFGDVDTRSQ